MEKVLKLFTKLFIGFLSTLCLVGNINTTELTSVRAIGDEQGPYLYSDLRRGYEKNGFVRYEYPNELENDLKPGDYITFNYEYYEWEREDDGSPLEEFMDDPSKWQNFYENSCFHFIPITTTKTKPRELTCPYLTYNSDEVLLPKENAEPQLNYNYLDVNPLMNLKDVGSLVSGGDEPNYYDLDKILDAGMGVFKVGTAKVEDKTYYTLRDVFTNFYLTIQIYNLIDQREYTLIGMDSECYLAEDDGNMTYTSIFEIGEFGFKPVLSSGTELYEDEEIYLGYNLGTFEICYASNSSVDGYYFGEVGWEDGDVISPYYYGPDSYWFEGVTIYKKSVILTAEDVANDFINNFEGKDEVTLKFKKGTNQTVTNFIDVFEEDSQKYINFAGTGSYTLKENGLVLTGLGLDIYLKGVQTGEGYYCKLISDPGFDASSGAELYPSSLSLSSGDPEGITSDSCKEMTVCASGSFTRIHIGPNSKSSSKDIKTCSVLTEIKIYLIESTCSFDGNTDTSKIKTKWAEMVELYNKLSSSEKALLVSSTNEVILRMISKYDYIYGKYGSTIGEDFLGRFSNYDPAAQGNKSKILNIKDINNSTWIIAVISIIGLTSVGTYFFYRKRKEE